MRSPVAEFVGTFVLVFAGTGAIVVDTVSGGVLGHVGVSLVFGLVVAAMIYAVGDVSGAHFNPAVTLGFWFAGRISARQIAPYAASQCAAAVLASVALRWLFPLSMTLGQTVPSGPLAQSFFLEIILTFFLVFVILSVTSGDPARRVTAGAAIGATVALGALIGGPISGGSMNPARSLGPAIVSGELANLWVYVAAPVVGAVLATAGCRLARGRDCCPASAVVARAD